MRVLETRDIRQTASRLAVRGVASVRNVGHVVTSMYHRPTNNIPIGDNLSHRANTLVYSSRLRCKGVPNYCRRAGSLCQHAQDSAWMCRYVHTMKHVFAWVAAFGIVFGGFLFMEKHGLPAGFRVAPSAEPVANQSNSPRAGNVPEWIANKVRAEQPERRHIRIYQCEVYGHTLYSEHPCPSLPPAQTVTRAPHAEPQHVVPSAPQAATAPEPRTRTYQEQYENFKRLSPSAPVQFAEDRSAAAAEAQRKRSKCKGLYDDVARLDAWARQPNPASTQDYIRQQRKNLTDLIYSLQCESQ